MHVMYTGFLDFIHQGNHFLTQYIENRQFNQFVTGNLVEMVVLGLKGLG